MPEPSETKANERRVELLSKGMFSQFSSQQLGYSMGAARMGAMNVILPPISTLDLLALYTVSPVHARCIQVTAESSLGLGIEGRGAKKIEDLCEFGMGMLFGELGYDLGVYGYAFLQVVRNKSGQILQLARLPAINTFKRVNPITGEVGGYKQIIYLPTGQQQIFEFEQNEVVMLSNPCPAANYYPIPKWYAAQVMVQLIDAISRFNRAFFKNNRMPQSLIVLKGGQLKEKYELAIKQMFSDSTGIEKQHSAALINLDIDDVLDVIRLSADSKEGDFLPLISQADQEIVIAHGLQPTILGILTAGKLGASNEVVAQLHAAKVLTFDPLANRVLDLMKPLLKELRIKREALNFKAIDVTPPDVADAPAPTPPADPSVDTPKITEPAPPKVPEKQDIEIKRKGVTDTELTGVLRLLMQMAAEDEHD
jgi:hypothetical protein